MDPETLSELDALASKWRQPRAAVMRRAVRELADRELLPPITPQEPADADLDEPHHDA